MTFTTRLKEEISKLDNNILEKRCILTAFLKYNSVIDETILIVMENASVTRFIYKIFKELYNINPKVTVRIQKKFKVKQIYILEIVDKVENIVADLQVKINLKFDTNEEKIAYLKGAFLGIGNISNPKTSGYHLEFVVNDMMDANYLNNIINSFKLNSKMIKRNNKYIIYLKMSECISDLIKMFKAINCLFEFEDIRIYRDHKNMVNRLNNCEIANQEKTIKSSLKQLEIINFLRTKDLLDLLDDNQLIVVEYREKYPDVSMQELSEIISLETEYKIGKSGINHHFIKLKKLMEKYNKKSE